MSKTDLELRDDGYWVWDTNIDGITFISTTAGTLSTPSFSLSKSKAAPVSSSLYKDVRLSFIEVPKAQELLRFRRYVQRRTNPQDLVLLRDVKDVVIFQVKQRLTPYFLDFFFTPEVDYFLRCLIIYFLHFIQVREWMSARAIQHADKIRLPGLRPQEREEREYLLVLRLLVATAYTDILLGYGETKRFHHTYRTATSWTQRDVRLWEWLIRISSRILWIVFHKRYNILINAEMDRLFRSERYVMDGRKNIPAVAAVLQSSMPSNAIIPPKMAADGCPGEQLQAQENPFKILSPLAQELTYGDYTWKVPGIGRVKLKDKEGKLEGIIHLLRNTEESVIGILGMPHSEVDTMLTAIGKRPPESRSLLDILQDVRDFVKHKDSCIAEFPRGKMENDSNIAGELKEARSVWRRNYDIVKW